MVSFSISYRISISFSLVAIVSLSIMRLILFQFLNIASTGFFLGFVFTKLYYQKNSRLINPLLVGIGLYTVYLLLLNKNIFDQVANFSFANH